MIIASRENSRDMVELHSVDQLTVHYGKISLKVPKEDLFHLASMFDNSKKEMPNENICAVYQQSESKFLLSYKGVTLSMCGGALLKFSELITDATKEYNKLYKVKTKSDEDIEQLLNKIEQSCKL